MTQNEIVKDWFVSSETAANNTCVQTRFRKGGFVDVRNSTDPEGPMVTFTGPEWEAFLKGAQKGEFDLS